MKSSRITELLWLTTTLSDSLLLGPSSFYDSTTRKVISNVIMLSCYLSIFRLSTSSSCNCQCPPPPSQKWLNFERRLKQSKCSTKDGADAALLNMLPKSRNHSKISSVKCRFAGPTATCRLDSIDSIRLVNRLASWLLTDWPLTDWQTSDWQLTMTIWQIDKFDKWIESNH